ncbi:ATP-binding cassette domain-containing protein [Streptomyces sp. NPDC095613]|uniref:ABC transporter ATP-binding protein n=1 Tax=Streptomyces sp. NPDC095613 TaxID=3155540 RepID=UPI00331C7366
MTTPHGRIPSAEPVLRIRGLCHDIRERKLFGSVDLAVRSGESVAVVGPSGSGKSSLLSCVLGLLVPRAGSVRVAGEEITRMKAKELARVRSGSIGMVFQSGELLSELSPTENVALAALLARTGNGSGAGALRRAEELLDELGVPRRGRTEELSGGERQRTALARALINSPALLLADEPTAALDSDTRDLVAASLFGLPRRRSCGLLVVTHDMRVAQRADRVLRLEGGTLTPVDAVPGLGTTISRLGRTSLERDDARGADR